MSRTIARTQATGRTSWWPRESRLYERHLAFDQVIRAERATPRDQYEAVARSIRDVLSERWLATEQAYQKQNAKRVYYVSLEFLMGRALSNTIASLQLDSQWALFCEAFGWPG